MLGLFMLKKGAKFCRLVFFSATSFDFRDKNVIREALFLGVPYPLEKGAF
jgi:hypothetical protein